MEREVVRKGKIRIKDKETMINKPIVTITIKSKIKIRNIMIKIKIMEEETILIVRISHRTTQIKI
jgi:hypothetical protein